MSFSVSKANSLSFKIETGVGTQNAGSSIEDNYLWQDRKTFFNCDAIGGDGKEVCHKYLCTDIVYMQLIYSNGGVDPHVSIETVDGDVIEVITELGGLFAKDTYLIDFNQPGVYACPGCYVVRIYSQGSTNLFTMGDDGTHEADVLNLITGVDLLQPNNALTQSATEFQAGAFSARIQASPAGVPNINHRLIYANDTAAQITLVAGTTYKATAWVYVPSGNPWAGSGNINLLANFDGSFGKQAIPVVTGWTDAVIHSATTVLATTTDTWTQLETTFTVGAVTDGSLVITSDTIPTVDEFIYVDTVEMLVLDNTLEGTSQNICLAASHPCTQFIQWSNDSNNFGIDYSNALTFQARISCGYHQPFYEDKEYEVGEDGDNSARVEVASRVKLKNFVTELIPPYMLDKLDILLAHDTVYINFVEYVSFDGDITPSYEDKYSILGKVETPIRLKDWDYQNRGV